jgi:DNA-binding NtrC family response regulator
MVVMNKRKREILILEDEQNHAELLKRSFESAQKEFNYELSLKIVSSLKQARKYLENNLPDLLITDFVLPDGKGTQLLCSDNIANSCPVMLMTAHGDEQKAVDAMKAGAMDYVVKSSTSLLSMPALADNVLKRWDILLEHKKNQKALEKSEY